MSSWLHSPGESFQSFLAIRPGLQEKYQAFLDAIRQCDAVPARVYALCQARIEQIHGVEATGISETEAVALLLTDYSPFSDAERVALVAAEKMPFQHHYLLDEEVDAIKSAFGDAGCVALLTAMAFFDVSARLDTTLGLKE